jgi:hypothetical protein
LVLKHIRNWSYEVLEREVRANLVYRDFTHSRRRSHTLKGPFLPSSPGRERK